MAPTPLLLSSSRTLCHFPFFPITKFPCRVSPIFCPSSSLPQTPSPHYDSSSIEPSGTGAAAPTRGDLFLDRQQSRSAATLVIKQGKKNSKKKRVAASKLSSAIACCYGCGAPLQTEEMEAPGYVDPETYELKKKHRQLRTVLCGRCKLLSHGHMVTAVGGHGGYPGGKQFVTAEELREKLSHLRYEKVDLLPKGTDFNCIGDWVVEATTKKKLNVISVHLTSSKSLVGIAGVIAEIQKEKKGREVYILGSANVGKSAFINALLKMMGEKDPVAAAAQKYKPIQSAVPGTTLGPIQIEAFQGGGKLFDTPGVHLHHRQAAVVDSEDLPLLAPKNRLRAQPFPVLLENKRLNDTVALGLNGFSIFWGGLVRVDIIKVLPQTRLTFYGPRQLPIHMVPTSEADPFYHRELGISLTPPTGKQRAEAWPGLQVVRQLHINFENLKRPACDIAISGLGWIAIEPFSSHLNVDPNANNEAELKELHLAVHVPKPVEVFVRPPMPVGKAGEEWYEYQDLTEKEEELRPKWFF